MELVTVAQLGSPIHINHMGTNDLHDQQERVATSLRVVIEGTHYQDCVLWSSVHLAHPQPGLSLG